MVRRELLLALIDKELGSVRTVIEAANVRDPDRKVLVASLAAKPRETELLAARKELTIVTSALLLK